MTMEIIPCCLIDIIFSDPIYQFRTYNIVNRAVNLITEIAKINENPSMKGKAAIRTIDDKPLNRQMAKQAIDEILDMLDSFEVSFPTTYNDNRNKEEIFINSWKAEEKSIPESAEKLPFLMPLFYEEAGRENERIKAKWPEVRERLNTAGTYAKLFFTI